MADIALQATMDNETRLYRIEVTDCETGNLVYTGPPRKSANTALYAALEQLVLHLVAVRTAMGGLA